VHAYGAPRSIAIRAPPKPAPHPARGAPTSIVATGMAVPRGDPRSEWRGRCRPRGFLRKGRRCAEAHSNAGEDTRFVAHALPGAGLAVAAARSALGSVSRMRPTGLVERLGRVLLDLATESVGVVVHRASSIAAVSSASAPDACLALIHPQMSSPANCPNSRSNRRVPRPSHSIRRGESRKGAVPADRVGAGECFRSRRRPLPTRSRTSSRPDRNERPRVSASSIWPSIGSAPSRSFRFIRRSRPSRQLSLRQFTPVRAPPRASTKSATIIRMRPR